MDEQTQLLTRAAWLYHEYGLTQDEVAERLGVSQSRVSRLLAEARRVGIVQVRVTRPLPEVAGLESALVSQLGVRTARVEPEVEGSKGPPPAAAAAARFLDRQCGCIRTLAIGWGTTLRAAAEALPSRPPTGIEVIDAVGRPPGNSAFMAVGHPIGLAWGARVSPIPAPAFVPDPDTATALRSSPVVASALCAAREADLVLVSVGGIGDDATLLREGVVPHDVWGSLRTSGAVGDVLGCFFDDHGRPVTAPGLGSRIGLTLDELRARDDVVVVAAGASKVQPAAVLLRCGIADGIITDGRTAAALLSHVASA